jgi:hypothetical protein
MIDPRSTHPACPICEVTTWLIFGRRQEALDAAVADLGPNARAVKGLGLG